MNHDTLRFRKTMGQFVTGVTVVSTRHDGECGGLTVNSFTSVSLDPLQILVCVSKNAASHEHIMIARKFAVSILAENQEMVSTIFAGAPAADRFRNVRTFDAPSGCPVIEGSIAWLDAEVRTVYDGSDHSIFLAEVTAMDIMNEHARPLVYHRGRYAQLMREPVTETDQETGPPSGSA